MGRPRDPKVPAHMGPTLSSLDRLARRVKQVGGAGSFRSPSGRTTASAEALETGYEVMMTGVPLGTIRATSATTGLYTRTQPLLTALPLLEEFEVPWIAI